MTEATKNLDELSDEEFLNEYAGLQQAAIEQELDAGSGKEPATSADDSGTEEEELESTGGAVSEKTSESEEEGSADSTSEEGEEEPGNVPAPADTSGVRSDPHQGSSTEAAEPEGEQKATQELDPDSELAKVLAPLKAAKRTIQVDNVEQARQLMQMGVDYSTKMRDLKPYQRMMKTLERAGLLEEDKLNHLIDLHQGKTEAIQKLLADSDIDPLELDVGDSGGYKPNDHMVGQAELEVDNVLDSLRDSPKFDATIQAVTDMDTVSKRTLMDNPHVIGFINEHMEAGIYEQIMDRLEREKLFGKHRGLSDLEAYRAVGNAMQEEGVFGAPNQPAPSSTSTTDQGHSQDSQGLAQSELKDRKRAASPPKGTAGKAPKKQDNFLSNELSDEEFEKLDWRKVLA